MSELLRNQVNERLSYNPETGALIWRSGHHAGRRAGRIDSGGHRQVCVDGRRYPSSHLIWILQTGCLPKACVDHINRDRADDRWVNLREASRAENARNSGRRTERYAFKGIKRVSRCKQPRWEARIRVAGKYKHLGVFQSPELAAHAYDQAARQHHGSFACTNFP